MANRLCTVELFTLAIAPETLQASTPPAGQSVSFRYLMALSKHNVPRQTNPDDYEDNEEAVHEVVDALFAAGKKPGMKAISIVFTTMFTSASVPAARLVGCPWASEHRAIPRRD